MVRKLEEQDNRNQKMIRRFKEIIILNHLKNDPLVTGYQIVTYIHREMGILVSPGMIYSTLYLLESHKLVEANHDQVKRTYRLTKKGESELQKMKNSIDSFLSSIFSEAKELTA